MAELQNNAPGKVEATDEVKRLAVICVTEGKTAAEIEDVSDKIRNALGAYLRCLGGQAESVEPQVSSGQAAGKDVVEADQKLKQLKRFEDQYQRFSAEDKIRWPWEIVRARLLDNNGRSLALAEEMNSGGILFGIDEKGNPLIADVN